MKKDKTKKGKTPQEMQDEIFRKMPAGKRLEVGFVLMEAGLKLRKMGLRDRDIRLILS